MLIRIACPGGAGRRGPPSRCLRWAGLRCGFAEQRLRVLETCGPSSSLGLGVERALPGLGIVATVFPSWVTWTVAPPGAWMVVSVPSLFLIAMVMSASRTSAANAPPAAIHARRPRLGRERLPGRFTAGAACGSGGDCGTWRLVSICGACKVIVGATAPTASVCLTVAQVARAIASKSQCSWQRIFSRISLFQLA